MVDPASPAHQLVGAVLNQRWHLVRLLGEGGMGAVYEGDSRLGEGKRAIKVLHAEFAEEPQILERFFAEATATQGLQHPNIVSVLEAARAEDGTPYLVMELLQGLPLGAYIDQGNPIPPHQAGPIIYQVLQALSTAHARKLVHRDLKPDNLFLIRDPRGGFQVKVLDFGIAKVMDVAGGMGSKTRTGVILGTPGYMSPEQIKNSKGVDPRSDLWSVGIIFYEMLTAKHPFPADSEFARLTTVLTTEVRPIEQVAPHLAVWGPFFRRALAKDPAQRFQSAEEMAQAVSSIARGGSVAPPPPTEQSAAASIPVSYQQPLTPQPHAQHAPATSVSGQPMRPSVAQVAQASSYVPGQLQPADAGRGSAYGAPAYAASAGPTHVSVLRPPGTPTITSSPPNVQVIDAPPQGAAWWVVGVVGFVCLGLGFALGMLVGG